MAGRLPLCPIMALGDLQLQLNLQAGERLEEFTSVEIADVKSKKWKRKLSVVTEHDTLFLSDI